MRKTEGGFEKLQMGNWGSNWEFYQQTPAKEK